MDDDERGVRAESCPLCAELREVAAALHDALLGLLCSVCAQDLPREVDEAERARALYLRYVERRLLITRAQTEKEAGRVQRPLP